MNNEYILSLSDTFDFEGNITINNIEFKNRNKKVIKIPLIVFRNNHIYIIKEIQGNLLNDKELLQELKNEMIDFQIKFQVSENMYSVFCFNFNEEDNHNELYSYSHNTNKALRIQSIKDSIMEDKNYIENARIADILNNILFSSNVEEKTKYDLSGDLYVRKHNKWFKCNEEDSDSLFYTTAFGGCLGLHKRNSKQFILYMLTCGLFGAGTVFDTLKLLLTMQRDKEGLYYPPLSDISKKWIIFLCSIAFTIFLLFIYNFILSSIMNVFSSFGLSVIEKKVDPSVIYTF